MPRLAALQSEWRVHPPAHWLIAAALKYRPPANSVPAVAGQPTIAQMRAAFPNGRL
jgi:hypothetical protein